MSAVLAFVLALSLTLLAWEVAASSSGASFDRIIIIVFENAAATSALANVDFKVLVSKGVLFSNYSAVTHPSQPMGTIGQLPSLDSRGHVFYC